MQPQRRGGTIRAAVAAALLVIGLGALVLWRVVSGQENSVVARGASPPSFVQVTGGRTYSLAVPGGVHALLSHGVPTSSSTSGAQSLQLSCTWSTPAGTRSALAVTPEGLDTKAENVVGSFVAPRSGRLHVDCAAWGAMFVPDSDDRPTDWAGFVLIVSIIALTIGVGLGLSVLRSAIERGRAGPTERSAAREDDKVE